MPIWARDRTLRASPAEAAVAAALPECVSVSYGHVGDGNVHLHKAADGSVVRKYAGHRDWVYSVAEHAGRKLVAAGSYDGEVRTWNADDAAPALSFTAIPGARTVAAAGQQTPVSQ